MSASRQNILQICFILILCFRHRAPLILDRALVLLLARTPFVVFFAHVLSDIDLCGRFLPCKDLNLSSYDPRLY